MEVRRYEIDYGTLPIRNEEHALAAEEAEEAEVNENMEAAVQQ